MLAVWDERGFLETALCAVSPREMRERISKARTATEATAFLTVAERSAEPKKI